MKITIVFFCAALGFAAFEQAMLSGICILIGGMLALAGTLTRGHTLLAEGEIAGILVLGVCTINAIILGNGNKLISTLEHNLCHVAIPLTAFLSCAAVCQRFILSHMDNLERGLTNVFGSKAALLITNAVIQLIGSITGEPTAGTLNANYLKDRIPDGKTATVGVGIAAGVGVGGAFLPYAAPAILIVWTQLEAKGFTITKLWLLLGPALLVHMIISNMMYSKQITRGVRDIKDENSTIDILMFVWIAILAVVHIIKIPGIIIIDSMTIIVSMLMIYRRQRVNLQSSKPLLVGSLMVCLEAMSFMAEPGLNQGIKFIVPVLKGNFWIILMLLFVIAGIITSFSDNALASLGLISVLGPLTGEMTTSQIDMFIVSILAGAVGCGLYLHASNLPNFPIKDIIGREAKDQKLWSKASLKYYATSVPAMLIIILVIAYFYTRS